MKLPASLALVAAAAALAPAAFAKENVEATLTSPPPQEASPGEEVTVSWLLESVDEDGRRSPFGASGVFVQLESASGGASTVGVPRRDGGRDGRFEAVVVVPAGGIGGIAIGLAGTVSGATGTRADYVYFPVTNSPWPAVTDPGFPGARPRPGLETPGVPAESSSGGASTWMVALGTAVFATLAAIGVVVLLRRRRHAPAA